MTAVTQAIPVDELARRAREARPGQGFATVIAAIFTVIGWLAGRTVTGIAFAGLSIRFGYLRGRGFTDSEIAALSAPEPEPAQPRTSKL